MEREKHKLTARAHIYEADDDRTNTEEKPEDKEKTTEDETGNSEPAYDSEPDGKVPERAKNAYPKIIETP